MSYNYFILKMLVIKEKVLIILSIYQTKYKSLCKKRAN